ncbi:MAG: hypothetical protein FJW34_07035 [Acidobacteria bacterium]|nr:hypothetical protein [Acidobacteriota bacterium]
MNQMINEAMANGYVNETKLGLALAFGGVGQAPGVGDTIANVCQVIDTIDNLRGALKEALNYGSEGLLWLKMKQVGFGILQIVTEPGPGLDFQADVLQMTLEQMTYNLEILRGLHELKLALRRIPQRSIRLSPRLYMLTGFKYNYPAGIEVSPDAQTRHSYETPLASIAFTAPTVLGRHVPFQVIGELPVGPDSGAYPIADRLGGQKRGDVYYLPVDLTYWAESDASTGDGVLEGCGRYRTASSSSRVLNWDATCRRGTQMLRVRLRNGETTLALPVVNRYMNQVTELRLPGVPDTGLSLSVGETRGGLRVIGASPHLEERFWPDLTRHPQCLDMAIGHPNVARLERGIEAAVTGLSSGVSTLKLLLGGSASDPAIKDISREIPVQVEAALLPELHKTTRIEGLFTGHHMVRRQDGTLALIGIVPPTIRVPELLFPPPGTPCVTIRTLWSGRNFEYAGKCSTPSPANCDVRVTGTLSPSGAVLETATFTGTSVFPGYQPPRQVIQEFTVRNLPFHSHPETGACRGARFFLTGPSVKDHVSAVRCSTPGETYVSTDWDKTSPRPSLEVRFVCPQ